MMNLNDAPYPIKVVHCIGTGVICQKRFHSRLGFGYGILLYIRKMPYFCPFTAHFGGFEGVFSYINDKSAILCPDKTEVADFVRLRVQSFKE